MSDEAHAPERPATFREVFAQREFRAIYSATALSWVGDYLAKAAVTVMVYQQTSSVALSAAAFAISYLPWLIGGPLLSTIAERHPYRAVMVICDLLRMVLIALVAIPAMPVELMLVLLFAATLAGPPSQSARSALLPLILRRDRLVVGLAINTSTSQAAQIGGYVAGAAIAAVNPRLALVVDAATFALSAAIIRFGVRHRPAAMTQAHRSHLLRETAQGFGLVFGTPVLRAVAIIVFSSMLFAIVPEGLAAAWAASLSEGEGQRGVYQALIMAANPVGFILGGLLVGRFVRPDLRRVLIRPFAVLAPLAMVPCLLNPSAAGVAALAAICGFAIAGLMPTANGLFVQALPHGFRARAFGVMQSGTQIMQGAAVLVTGLLADRFEIPVVVGLWSLAGVVLMLFAATLWPSAARFNAAIAEASRLSREPETRGAPVAKAGAASGSVESARGQPAAPPAGAAAL